MCVTTSAQATCSATSATIAMTAKLIRWHKRGRFQLRVDARTETELGTLRGYAAINFNWATNRCAGGSSIPTAMASLKPLTYVGHDASNSEGIEHAYVELGGFRIGVTDSYFVTFTGYASGVVNDGLIYYGPFTTHQIAYTFDAGNGFSVGAAVEEGSDGENFGAIIQDYAPHVVVGAAYKSGIFGLSACRWLGFGRRRVLDQGPRRRHPERHVLVLRDGRLVGCR